MECARTCWNLDVASTLTPVLLSVDPPRELRFASVLGTDWMVRMEHAFVFEETTDGRSRLRQTFEVSGVLARPLWRQVSATLARFAAVGTELSRFLEDPRFAPEHDRAEASRRRQRSVDPARRAEGPARVQADVCTVTTPEVRSTKSERPSSSSATRPPSDWNERPSGAYS